MKYSKRCHAYCNFSQYNFLHPTAFIYKENNIMVIFDPYFWSKLYLLNCLQNTIIIFNERKSKKWENWILCFCFLCIGKYINPFNYRFHSFRVSSSWYRQLIQMITRIITQLIVDLIKNFLQQINPLVKNKTTRTEVLNFLKKIYFYFCSWRKKFPNMIFSMSVWISLY